MNPTSIWNYADSIPSLAQRVKDLALLCLWYWPGAVVLFRLLAWELPHAADAALKTKNKTKQKQ